MRHTGWTDESWHRLYVTYVQPYYLHMMGTNASEQGLQLLGEIAERGRSVDPDFVFQLLRGGAWREQVMGAWYSLVIDPQPRLVEEVKSALRTSHGYLTSPLSLLRLSCWMAKAR